MSVRRAHIAELDLSCSGRKRILIPCEAVHQWKGEGGTRDVLPFSVLKKWVQNVVGGKLAGPTSLRHISAMLDVAALISSEGPGLFAAMDKAYKIRSDHEPNKCELIDLHTAELTEIESEHNLEVENLRETIEELDYRLDLARARVRAAQTLKGKAVCRSKSATARTNERWKEKVASLRDTWRAAAIEDVQEA